MSSTPSAATGELTPETSAAVASMMQYMIQRAETGEEPTDSENKPGLDDLMKILSGDTQAPMDQVYGGTVPSVPVIAVVPENRYMYRDIAANYRSLMDSQSLCQLYANIMQLKDRPQGWDITKDDQAALAFSAQAQYAWQAIRGPLAEFFIFNKETNMSYNKTLDKSSIHDGFLNKIFDDFRFDKHTMKQLDDLLTRFTSSLGSIPMGDGGKKTIDHVIQLNLVSQINVSGDDYNPVYAYQPTTTVVYLKIDADSYKKSISKQNRDEKVDFKMDFTILKCELNVKLFEKSRGNFDKVFNMLTGRSMSAFTDLLVKKVESESLKPKP